ncbi:MAG: PKD domain-containing protein [Bacteroidota bacterium]
MRRVFALIVLQAVFLGQLFAQCGGTVLTVANPSFEGTPAPHVTPPSWDICMPGVTPDTQPGSWGITLPPSNGSSYIGLVSAPSINWIEGAGQTLSSPMIAGTTYNFTIDLAVPASADPATGILIPPNCVQLDLWGGMSGVNSGCDMSELLWSSASVTNFNWQTYNLTFTPTQNWNHILFLIHSLGCTDGQYLLMDNMSPITPQSDIPEFGWTDVCIGSPMVFHDSSTSVSGQITNWGWSFGDGGTSTSVNPTHTYAAPGSYNVTLVIISNVPCTTTVTHTVVVHPVPTVTASANPASLCTGGSSTLTAGGANTYLWSNGLGTTNPVTVQPATTTTYTVTGTSFGCTGTANVTVSVAANLTLAVNPSSPVICIGDSVDLTASGAANYTWSPATGLSATTGAVVTANPAVTTTYSVNGDNGSGCTGSTTVTVTVASNASLVLGPTNPSICTGESVQLTATGAASYVWDPPTGLSATTGALVTASPAATTTYTVSASTGANCTASGTITVTVAGNSGIGFTAEPLEGCTPLEVQFNYVPGSDVVDSSWVWNFDDIQSGNYNVADSLNPIHTFNQQGTYDVLLSVDLTNGCKGTGTMQITSYPWPHAEFDANPKQVYMNDPSVQFTDESTNAVAWEWNFGDPVSQWDSSSEMQNPVHIYSEPGTYEVILIVTSPMGCSDTVKHTIVVYPELIIFVPNAFTPNGNRLNDVFTPFISGIEPDSYIMRIYDRWGKQIYETSDLSKGWDGNHLGKYCQEDVYVWLIYFTAADGKRYKEIGHVTLLK